MSKDEPITAASVDALRERFAAQSRKAQAYYTVMHVMRGRLGGDEAAAAWMEAPLEALGGQTPAQLVGAGRAEEVLTYVGTLSGAR